MYIRICVRLGTPKVLLATHTLISMTEYEHWSIVWAAVTAIFTALAFIVISIAAVLTFQQIRESTRTRQLESTLAILTHTSTSEFRSVRRTLYTQGEKIASFISKNPPWSEFNLFIKSISDGHVGSEEFHSYAASLENISLLVLHDLVPDNFINHYFAPRAVNHWNTLLPFIKYMRQLYSSPDYLQHFEMFISLIESGALDANSSEELSLQLLTRSQQMKRTLLENRLKQRLFNKNREK